MVLTSQPPLQDLQPLQAKEQKELERKKKEREQKYKELEEKRKAAGKQESTDNFLSYTFGLDVYYEDLQGLLPLLNVFEKVLAHCLCCSRKFVHKNDGYAYYQCPNQQCFIRNRHKMEQLIRNALNHGYYMKQIPQKAFDCVKFGICKQCGDQISNHYHLMTAIALDIDNDSNKYSKLESKPIIHSTKEESKYNFNNLLEIYSYVKQVDSNKKHKQNKQEKDCNDKIAAVSNDKIPRWTQRKKDKLYNPQNMFHLKLDQIESLVYHQKRLKDKISPLQQGIRIDTVCQQSPQCICGNGHMVPKINCKGKWYFDTDFVHNDQEFYFPTKLKCNVCKFDIQKWDPYFTCQFGKVMNIIGHETGFRICKLCSILLNQPKLKPYQNTIKHNVNVNNKMFRKLSKDVMYLVLKFAISSYIEIINLSRVNKYFAGHLSLVGKKQALASIEDWKLF